MERRLAAHPLPIAYMEALSSFQTILLLKKKKSATFTPQISFEQPEVLGPD